MLRAVIFDMDDVILNSRQFDYPAWERFFADYGQKLSITKYKGFLGMKNAEIIKKFLTLVGDNEIEVLQNKKESYYLELMQKAGVGMLPGLDDFLDDLQGKVALGIATSAPQIKVDGIFKHLNLNKYFKVIITADQVAKGKPDPELFLKAAQGLNIEPRDCLVVEDAPSGVEAAKNAGMKCIAITTTHERTELGKADLIIDNFFEINLDILKNLF